MPAIERQDLSLSDQVRQLSAQTVELCYQCHKCMAGCPVGLGMDYGPDRILRMVALDQRDRVLASRDIWLCAGCYTCATRCPNGIDLIAVMDALRQVALAQGYRPAERDAVLFHRLFLGVVQRFGRSYEAAMLGLFKVLSSVPIWKDIPAGVNLFVRGKVPLIPPLGGNAAEVRRIFTRCVSLPREDHQRRPPTEPMGRLP